MTALLDSRQAKKQEAFIDDPSGYIKLMLWRGHADSVSEGSTQLFDKVTVKLTHQEKYLDTWKSDAKCKISSVNNFTESLQPVQNISTVKDLTGKILGVTNLNKRPLQLLLQQKYNYRSSAPTGYIYKKQATRTTKLEFQCTMMMIYSLLATSTDDEIIEKISDLELVKVSNDSQNNKVIYIDQIKV